MTDLKGAVLTREVLEDGFEALERETDRYNREGYRVVFPAWLMRWAGWDGPPGVVVPTALVCVSERGPMTIYLKDHTWSNLVLEGGPWTDLATRR